MGEAANRQIALAEQQFQDYITNERPMIRAVADEALGIQRGQAQRANALADYQLENMRFLDNRFRTVGIPFEDQLIADVGRFDSQAYKDSQVDMARADVQGSFDNAAAQMRRGMDRRGVNPFSGASVLAENNAGLSLAKASADAANKTRMAADQIGLSNKFQLYGGMKGMAGLGATSAQLATGAMGTGLNAAGGMGGMSTISSSAGNAAFNSAMGGMSAGVSGLGNYSSLGIQAANVNAQNNPFNTILGAATGAGMAYLTGGLSTMGKNAGWANSDRRLKTNIAKVGQDVRTGLSIYEFEYLNGDGTRFRGFMADEVETLDPQAVSYDDFGFASVDYARLGTRMVEVSR
jgi:hypothetical protein